MENPLNRYINKPITIHTSLGTVLLLVSGTLGLAYVGWEMYWYQKVGLSAVRWHTHLFPYFALWWILALLGKVTSKGKVLGSVSVFVGIFFLVEAKELVFGGNKTYHEKKYGFYVSPYETYQTSNFHTWEPGKPSHQLVSVSGEFEYWRPTNLMGFSDGEWKSPDQTLGHKRILALGDSFTEGDGAPYDSSYVAFLRRYLLADGDSSYVLNGGICGSDPFENFMNLEHLLIGQKPDYVIQTLSTNDMYTDIAVKGGFARFGANGPIHEPGPWWEPIFAMSYVSRSFFLGMGSSTVLVKEDDPDLNRKLHAHLEELFARYVPFCRKNGITLLVVILPNCEEVVDEKMRFDFGRVKRLLSDEKGVYVRDLMPYYVAQKKASPQGIEPYYWPLDRHHNGKGYGLMAAAIYSHLKPILSLTEAP